jgi:Ca2+-binding EF-hand superfamily protein
MSEERMEMVKKAYAKLDVNGDGTVRLDDIAQLFDASQHPDVLSGKKEESDVYMEFMSLWDTQVKDGIITFEEFSGYYKDISCSVVSDSMFNQVMIDAWKLDA